MPNEDCIGALWFKTSEKGDYFTGEVEMGGVKQRIVVFANKFKDAEKKPDWKIFKSKPMGGGQ